MGPLSLFYLASIWLLSGPFQFFFCSFWPRSVLYVFLSDLYLSSLQPACGLYRWKLCYLLPNSAHAPTTLAKYLCDIICRQWSRSGRTTVRQPLAEMSGPPLVCFNGDKLDTEISFLDMFILPMGLVYLQRHLHVCSFHDKFSFSKWSSLGKQKITFYDRYLLRLANHCTIDLCQNSLYICTRVYIVQCSTGGVGAQLGNYVLFLRLVQLYSTFECSHFDLFGKIKYGKAEKMLNLNLRHISEDVLFLFWAHWASTNCQYVVKRYIYKD